MVQINPSDLPALPVEQLAQFLLGCAREDPTLLARSNSGPLLHRDPEVRAPLRVPIRVPLGTPIDLAATPADPMIEPDDTPERPAGGMARPIEASAPRDNRLIGPYATAAGPIDLTPWLDDNEARPIEGKADRADFDRGVDRPDRTLIHAPIGKADRPIIRPLCHAIHAGRCHGIQAGQCHAIQARRCHVIHAGRCNGQPRRPEAGTAPPGGQGRS